MKSEIRWPQKGDNPFLAKIIDRQSPTWALLDWFESWRVDDSFYALAFKEAGDKIIKELSRGKNGQQPDMYFMPIAYLYRHSLELAMKVIVGLGIRLEIIEEDKKLSSVLKKHDLHELWKYVRKIVSTCWPEESQKQIEAAEQIVCEFHKIDVSGQNLRYSKELSGNSSVAKLPESVELTHLQDVFSAIYNFLEGCEAGLNNAIETKNEMLRESI